MKKRTYIQPKMDTMVLPQDALMGEIALAGSPTMATVGTNTGSGAPFWRPRNPTRTPVF